MFWNKKKSRESAGLPVKTFTVTETNEATARAQRCADEINGILMKHRCFFNPIVIFSGQGGFSTSVKIMPIMDEVITDPDLAKIHNDGHDPKKDN